MAEAPPADAIRIDDTLVVWTVNGRTKWAFVPAPPPPPTPPAAPVSRRPLLVKVLLALVVVFVVIPLGVALLPAGFVAGPIVFVVLIVSGVRRRFRRAART